VAKAGSRLRAWVAKAPSIAIASCMALPKNASSASRCANSRDLDVTRQALQSRRPIVRRPLDREARW